MLRLDGGYRTLCTFVPAPIPTLCNRILLAYKDSGQTCWVSKLVTSDVMKPILIPESFGSSNQSLSLESQIYPIIMLMRKLFDGSNYPQKLDVSLPANLVCGIQD
jgi:hypothetical protein